MILIGFAIALVVTFLSVFFFGEAGGLVLLFLLLGMAFGGYMKLNQILYDLKLIKSKLGLDEEKDFHLTDEEIEQELELEQDQGKRDKSDV